LQRCLFNCLRTASVPLDWGILIMRMLTPLRDGMNLVAKEYVAS
jgi:hypothetical protein